MVSVALSLLLNMFAGAGSVASAFTAGWDQARAEANQKDMTFGDCQLIPKESGYGFKAMNTKSGTWLSFDPTSINYKGVVAHDAYGGTVQVFTGIAAICAVLFFCYLWWVFFGLIRHINRGEIFTTDTERRFRHIGIAMLLFYLFEWVFTILLYLYNAHIIQIEGFEVALGETPSAYSLITGIFLFIVAQIFTIAREMKEEQELTI